MFQSSPISKRLLRYFDEKFGQKISLIAFLKCCAVVSCKLERPRLSVLDVAPSRQLKSYTSTEAMRIFDQEFWIDMYSDFTMNSLRRYSQELKNGKCLLVNDGTTLLASKAQRTKDRLVGGLSELFADGRYTYQDFQQKFTLIGKVTMVLNITSEAYRNYKDRLFGLTFSERFCTAHHRLTISEQSEWNAKKEASKRMSYDDTISIDDIETHTQIPKKYYGTIEHLARDFSYASLKSRIGCQDLIKATLAAHAALNKRREVCRDDLQFVEMIQRYLVDPFSPYEGRIVKYRAEGLSFREIARKIGKPNYLQQIQRVIKKAELRGILDSQSANDSLALTPRKAGDDHG